MARKVSDSDSVRRQNRGLVLGALRVEGPLSRTALASGTGLSHASITAITQDLVEQGIILDLEPGERADARGRGRPATLVGFNRQAGSAALFEIDVNRARLSLVDYGGILVDRLETQLTPKSFAETPPTHFLAERLQQLQQRNPEHAKIIQRVAISVQGILNRDGQILKWSPVAHIANTPFAAELAEQFALPVSLHKRGRLLAEGARWLDPALADASVATVFVGSTVAMGMTFRGQILGRSDEGATEFGHMNHQPNGALCRCGMRGCVEAYASDYGVLRTAYSVPETATPAPAVPAQEYEGLIARAEAGERAATHAFNLAGRAVGFGLSRMMAVFDPSHILIVGPGARAFGLMQSEIYAALAGSLVCRVNGLPQLIAYRDEREPVFRGLLMKTLNEIDQTDFATRA
ncbi:Sugar kinase of the NBD/HSP70 family, may contain an N-terminal HTH domain [Devosia sp. YR412]|uniref:ROK family transcriptional regulator n=1 Tax=Devosia sp. YR412 TaxID=1881030 RepID=UPI0008D56C1B|nr:ROK family transcriptional regulator [Devosia sp. YR412]SEQ44017.1 Sugar kinase of the NBD/HSP70 family, may contain an N-terminal HTH domain [Devosia sp. YR412]